MSHATHMATATQAGSASSYVSANLNVTISDSGDPNGGSSSYYQSPFRLLDIDEPLTTYGAAAPGNTTFYADGNKMTSGPSGTGSTGTALSLIDGPFRQSVDFSFSLYTRGESYAATPGSQADNQFLSSMDGAAYAIVPDP